ncbi:MAG: hypothetical protein ABI591_02610 [Kofleriaceae bacterium]
MRLALVALLFGTAYAAPAPLDTIDMGKWDCGGTRKIDVVIRPGEHLYVFHGTCDGAEGQEIEIEPAPKKAFAARQRIDHKAQTLSLWVRNDGQILAVKMYVFVGFA